MTPPRKPATVSQLAPFGKLDGEKIERVYLKVNGMIRLDHAPKEGETIVLVVKGDARKLTVTHVFDVLSKVYNATVSGAEPEAQLRDRCVDYLIEREDGEEGRQQIPGIKQEGDDDEDGDGE